jgi:hypothetical protein
MLCQHCEAQVWSGKTRRRVEERSCVLTCDRCGVAILTLEGVVVGVGDDTLARLARFGLASTGRPLLEPAREGS